MNVRITFQLTSPSHFQCLKYFEERRQPSDIKRTFFLNFQPTLKGNHLFALVYFSVNDTGGGNLQKYVF